MHEYRTTKLRPYSIKTEHTELRFQRYSEIKTLGLRTFLPSKGHVSVW